MGISPYTRWLTGIGSISSAGRPLYFGACEAIQALPLGSRRVPEGGPQRRSAASRSLLALGVFSTWQVRARNLDLHPHIPFQYEDYQLSCFQKLSIRGCSDLVHKHGFRAGEWECGRNGLCTLRTNMFLQYRPTLPVIDVDCVLIAHNIYIELQASMYGSLTPSCGEGLEG